MVIGKFSLSDYDALVLFDLGSTNSYISSALTCYANVDYVKMT